MKTTAAVSLWLVALLFHENSHGADINQEAFALGPYQLGMTNTQAAKFGLSNCAESNGIIKCTGSADTLPVLRHPDRNDPVIFDTPSITFSKITKQITKIDQSVFSVIGPADPRFEEVLRTLRIDSCTPEFIEHSDKAGNEICHRLPNMTRTRSSRTQQAGRRYDRHHRHLGGFDFSVEQGPKAQRFLSRRKAEDLKAKQVRAEDLSTQRKMNAWADGK